MPALNHHRATVLRALRADPATASVPFILTAKGEKNGLRTGMNLGADDYLTKPIGRDDLVATIEARFTRKSQQRTNFDLLFTTAAVRAMEVLSAAGEARGTRSGNGARLCRDARVHSRHETPPPAFPRPHAHPISARRRSAD